MIRLYAKQFRRLQRLLTYAVIATNSDHLSAEYARHGFATHRLPYPVFADNSERPRATRTDSDKSRRLLFAGRMDRLKGGQILIEALPAIRAGTGRDIQLTFVGDGPERSLWEKIAKKIGAASPGIHIEFKGWLDRVNIARAYAEADLLVVPSLWPEPCGVVGVEAALYAVPAVAFAVGGIPDWLHSGENGFLAPADPPTAFGLADAAVRALDPLHHERLCTGARKLALRWTLERHCNEFDLLVARVMQVAAPSSAESVQAEISSPVAG
jgi:glycosyltransferase involved in cell wall biosynthesis